MPPCSLETRPREALRLGTWQATIRHHDRYPLFPHLVEVLGHRELFYASRGGPAAKGQPPRDPRLIDILGAPIRRRLKHRHLLPPQRRLARQRTPLLLASGIVASPRRAFPRAWGKRLRRRGEPLLPAPLEQFA